MRRGLGVRLELVNRQRLLELMVLRLSVLPAPSPSSPVKLRESPGENEMQIEPRELIQAINNNIVYMKKKD